MPDYPHLRVERPADGVAERIAEHCRQLASQLEPAPQPDAQLSTDAAVTATVRRLP